MRLLERLKLVSYIILLFVGISNANADSTIENDSKYTLEYGMQCQDALMTQILESNNKIDSKIKVKIDALLGKLDKQYSDEKLFVINKKILSILEKTKKDSAKFNLYTYLLLKLDSIIDSEIYDTKYIKTECNLLLKPLVLNDDITKNENKYSELLNDYPEIVTNEKELKEKIEILKKKDSNFEPLYDLDTKEVVSIYVNKLSDEETAYKSKEFLLKEVTEDIEYIKSMSIEDYKDPSKLLYEKRLPMWLTSPLRDESYDKTLNKTEIKRLEDIEGLMVNKKIEVSKMKYEALRAEGTEGIILLREAEAKEKEYNVLALESLYLIRKKWEIKNICIEGLSNGLALKDIDTFKQVGFKTYDEEAELRHEYDFAIKYGYDLSCLSYRQYPELKTKLSDISSLSRTKIESLYKNDGFNPNTDDTSFIPRNVYTNHDDEVKDYVKLTKQMKYLHFEMMLNIKDGKTGSDIYDKLNLIQNYNYFK